MARNRELIGKCQRQKYANGHMPIMSNTSSNLCPISRLDNKIWLCGMVLNTDRSLMSTLMEVLGQ